MTAPHGVRLRDVVVVGGSVAGIRTAMALRRRGYDGHIRVISAEAAPHYYRPGLSKAYLSDEQSAQDLTLPIPDDLGLELWSGASATTLDSVGKRLTVRRPDDTVEFGYDGLVIASGLTPKVLSLSELAGIHYVRELSEARVLREELKSRPRVVVIGGGLIGCEVAATCRKLGLDVTVVEAADHLLEPVLGETAGRLVTELHREHGVQVRTGVGLAGIAGQSRVEAVDLSTGERLPADLVVVAVGSRPRTDWLEGSGLQVRDGVVCAANLRALGADSVVAVGDVARVEDSRGGGSTRIEHWENAVRQADTAARTLLEGPGSPPFTGHTTFWSTQHGLQLHVSGRPAATDELRLAEGRFDDRCAVATYHCGERVSAILALNQPQRLRAYRHLLDTPDRATAQQSSPI